MTMRRATIVLLFACAPVFATKASGEVKSVKSFTRGEAKCRTVSIANKAQGRTSDGNMNFCRNASGKWTVSN